MLRYLKNKWYQSRYFESFIKGENILSYPPREIFVEPTNHCNLKCVMCPQSRGIKRSKGYMDMELYRKIISEAKDFNLRRLNLFFGGESLLHPGIAEMITIAKEAGIFVRLHTNGVLLNSQFSRKILLSGLDMISFSFDGETKKQYETMRKNTTYEQTLTAIKEFLRERRILGKRNPVVQVQVIKDYDPALKEPHVSAEFRRIFEGLEVDNFSAIWFLSFGEHLYNSVYKYPKGKYYQPCRQLWSRFAVSWDGAAAACCIDLDGENIIGDVKRETLLSIWNGKEMARMRRLMAEKRFAELNPCRSCNLIWLDEDFSELKKKKIFLRGFLGTDEKYLKG